MRFDIYQLILISSHCGEDCFWKYKCTVHFMFNITDGAVECLWITAKNEMNTGLIFVHGIKDNLKVEEELESC